MTQVINVANDFAILPAGRYKTDGSYTGEHFRELLENSLNQSNDIIQIDFDGVLGAGSSFLDESFAGLIRNKIISKQDFGQRIRIVSTQNPDIAEKIMRYIQNT